MGCRRSQEIYNDGGPSRLILGALGFGSLVHPTDVSRILDEAQEHGIRTLDVAGGYGGGHARRILSTHLGSHPGQTWEVWEKIGLEWREAVSGKGFELQSYLHDHLRVRRELEVLGSAYPDSALAAVQLHAPAGSHARSTLESLAAFADTNPSVKFGFSNHSPEETISAHQVAVQQGLVVSHSQVQVSLLEQRACRDLLPVCKDLGMQIAANRVLARGLLARQLGVRTKRSENSVRISSKEVNRREDLEEIQKLAEQLHVSPVSLALSWLFDKARVDFAIIGVSEPGQITGIIKQLEGSASQLDWKEIEKTHVRLFESASNYPESFFDKS